MIVDEMVTTSYPPGTHVMRDGELLDGREFEGTMPVRRIWNEFGGLDGAPKRPTQSGLT